MLLRRQDLPVEVHSFPRMVTRELLMVLSMQAIDS